jgi:hypothetical protein
MFNPATSKPTMIKCESIKTSKNYKEKIKLSTTIEGFVFDFR